MLERDDAIAVLEATRAAHQRKLEALREIEPHAASAERFGPHAVLRYGVGLSEFAIRWCDETLNELKER